MNRFVWNLRAEEAVGFEGLISRSHSIPVVGPDDDIKFPVYSLVGGKWTTFRALAEQGMVTVHRAPSHSGGPNVALLEQVLHGLERL